MSMEIEQNNSPLESYIAFPFASDEEYQQGLASLVAGGAMAGELNPEEKDEILRRTRVFYFNRSDGVYSCASRLIRKDRVTGNALSVEEVRNYECPQKGTQTQESTTIRDEKDSTNDETRILTFAELQQLIESGKVDQIPNNKVIPELLNEAPPSQSTAPSRKKPWEVALAD
ncbi:hypothetical protein H0H92_004240 [Tricholoma furcatifolium]|nr:hypothetical protein H0H92_004240 [Tricholoma furcatifolium]